MVDRGRGGLRGGAIDSHGDHRIAMLGAIAGLASREGVEVEGMDAAAVSYPGFEADLAVAAGERRLSAATVRCRHGHRDRRPRRGRQVHRRPRRRRGARLHLPRLGGDVPLRGAGRARARRRPRRRRGDGRARAALEIELDGERVALDGRDVSAAIREPRVTEAASRVSVHPAVREALVARQRAADRRRALRRRGPRHRHRGQPRRAAEGLPHRLRRGAGPPPRGRRPARTRRACSPPSASATSATRAASTAPCAPPTTRSSSTPPGSTLDEVVERVVALARERGLA